MPDNQADNGIMEYRELTPKETEDIRSRILYEDNHIIIINKKVGEIVQGDKTGDETMADRLKAYIAARDSKPGKVFVGIPHRIDRPVSGITMFAKTSKALERLSAMFRDGMVHKTYWALVCNRPEQETAQLESWLVRNEKINKSFVLKSGNPKNKEAKLAKLIYKQIGATDRYYLLEVELLTGRHHQIRCQLSSIGCPIKGDLKYGAPRSNPDGGISLHARQIRFIHPVKKTEIDIKADVPASWRGVSGY